MSSQKQHPQLVIEDVLSSEIAEEARKSLAAQPISPASSQDPSAAYQQPWQILQRTVQADHATKVFINNLKNWDDTTLAPVVDLLKASREDAVSRIRMQSYTSFLPFTGEPIKVIRPFPDTVIAMVALSDIRDVLSIGDTPVDLLAGQVLFYDGDGTTVYKGIGSGYALFYSFRKS